MNGLEKPVEQETEVLDEHRTRQRDWLLFGTLTFLFMFGFTVYMGVFTNFFRESLRGDELALGGLESIREIPGLIAALMAGIVVALAESRVAALGLVITGTGIAMTGFAPSFWSLVAINVYWSIGFHLWSTVSPAITLTLAQGYEGGRHLGRMRSVGAVATIAALAIAWLVSLWVQRPLYTAFFIVAGAAIAAAGFVALKLSPLTSAGRRQRLILRREYGLYYLLTFLEGCRRQVFSIFALFALIKIFHTPLEVVLGLMLLNAVLTALTSPAMGRFIDRVGERRPLGIYAAGIVFIFLGYATIPNPVWLYALYVVDNVLFTFSIGINTFLHKIVRPGELTPSLAMGTTMNHIAAVSLPVLGALLWKETGNYRMPFYVGAGLAVIALFVTQRIPDTEPKLEPALEPGA